MENMFNSEDYIKTLGDELVNDFIKAGKSTHPCSVGSGREKALMNKLKSILPHGIGVGSGFVFDSYGNTSAQCDLIIYAFDTDGDTFRYTYKRNWTDTNLEDIGLIDLGIFYEKYKIISKSFDYLINNFCTYLNDLYHKTFTTKLNRNQIEEISKKLPPVALWKSDEFDRTLNSICNEYAISKTDLSKAIDLIKSHYLFCNNIGLERKFKAISEPTFEKFRVFLMDHINRKRKRTTDTPYYDITEHESYSYFDESFEEEGVYLINELSNEELCTLVTFYEYSCS